MGGLIGVSYALPSGWPVELLQASAKAGFVGGIADWFAVTALFRHPLGLPIPHTAIIPQQKQRLGRALGRFVAGHVFTQAELSRTLTRLDLPGIVARFLADPAATITDRLELRVGRDLQYVRINGTLVGFLVGGVLWALLHALFGHVAV